ncbi:hypothetical protein SAMN04488510_10155 [Fervidobacterium changbaicum]|nr:hypothetical protein [Fervidobacterium changbaicum]SDG90223.1 hypothetical protein SAMN04488510_10155 [Fervidobacterium changbaicum]
MNPMVLTVILIVVLVDLFVLAIVVRYTRERKERDKQLKNRIEAQGYRYVGPKDIAFEKEFSKKFAKLNPYFKWKKLMVKNISTFPDQDSQVLFFELTVTAENYRKKYLCLLHENFTSQLPDCSVVPRPPLSALFSKSKAAFDRSYKVIPTEASENIPEDLKQQILRYKRISVILTKGSLLITKEYERHEDLFRALNICQEILDILRMYD